MSAEDIAGSHEELLRHGCVEIKKEKVEVEVEGESQNLRLG